VKKYFAILKKYGIITIGVLITALALVLFLAPNHLTSGGISGLATVLHFVIGVPIGVISLALNVPIFIAGFLANGKNFGIKTLYATLTLSVFIDVFSALPPVTNDVFLASLFGGALMGTGLGIVFLAGATTGGTDIVAALIKRKLRHFPIGRLVLSIDVLIIIFATVVFWDFGIGLYSAISMFVCSYIIDTIIDGGKFAKTVFIISDHYQSIADSINHELERGVTGLLGCGMYSGNEKVVLMCTLKSREIPRLKDVVRSKDSSAFVVLTDVREVLGEGFIKYEGGSSIE
jgi:uncharacterized membrane-anchored protein YitT (DUF2179 family)